MNPFTERSRITDPARFTGRWREVGMVFDRLEQRRPVLLSGPPGSGKSSLLTHVAQSAAAVMELPKLTSFYLDLSGAPDEAFVYHVLLRELGSRGNTASQLEVALGGVGRTVLICLDEVQVAVAAGWGVALLERLARLARRSTPVYPGGVGELALGDLDLLVLAVGEPPPALDEPFMQIRLGALSPSEVRLLAEAYLYESGVTFNSEELRALGLLSAGHPAYLQRAAYHLFRSRFEPDYNWREAYLDEAREQPIAGAPLPPEVFQGEEMRMRNEARYGELAQQAEQAAAQGLELSGQGGLVAAVLPLIAALVALQISGNWLLASAILIGGYLVAALALRKRAP